MANVAINRETGEILVVGADGQWQPAQRARNPQTGQELYNDGSQWLPTPQPPQPPRGVGESLARGAGLAARALAPIGAGALAGAAMGAPFGGVGAIPGAIAGATAAGIAVPVSDLLVGGYQAARDYLTPQQRTLSDLVAPRPQQRAPLPSQAVEQLMTAAGLPQPETASERLASTALRAGTEAMTGAGAARQIASALPITSQFGRPIAETLAAGPGIQTAAALSGATATQGLLEAGAPGAVALPVGVAASMVPTMRPSNIFPARNPGPRLENLEALRQAGVPLTPAQELGNPSASVFESVMRYLPTSAPTVAKAEDATMRGWTRAVNRQFGLDSDIATPEVLTAYQRQWGQKADALEAAIRLRPDDTFADQVSNMRSQYTRGLDDGLYRSFDSQLRRVEDFIAARSQGAEIPGTNYRMINSELNFAIDAGKRSGDPRIQEYGKAMERLRDSFSGLMQRSASSTPTQAPGAPPGPQLRGPQGQPLLAGPEGQGLPRDLSQEWKDLNRDYALFSRVKEAMGSATGKDKINTGFIPPSALAQAERASLGSDVYGMAQDPFTRLVRAGESILPNPTPNSGTAQRSMAQDILTGARRGAPAAGAGAAAGAAGYGIDPLLSLALPYVSSKMWFGRPVPPERQGLLGMRALYGAMGAEE